MSKDTNNTQNFLVGTLVGGLVGTVAALLLAPKSGSELRQDVSDKYEDFTDMIENGELNRFWSEPEPEINTSSVVWGTVAGGILAAAATLLLAPKTGKALRKDLMGLTDYSKDQIVDTVNDLAARYRKPLKAGRKILRKKH